MKVLSSISICLIFLVHLAEAKVTLPAILGSNMVLQQKSKVKIWGKAKSKSLVNISTGWSKNQFTGSADANGNFVIAVSTPTAGGPYKITINDGEEKQP